MFFFRRKMHLCPECDKHYLSKLSLTRHMVIHSQERKFLCEDCGKSIGCKDHLEGHKSSNHQAPKRFACGNCAKVFVYKKNMLYHQRKGVCPKSYFLWYYFNPKQSTTPSLSVLKSHTSPCLASCNYSSQARQKSLHLLKTWLRYHKCLKSYQYMCNIVKSRVNNSKSSRTYTQEARETPVLNLITLW